MQIKQSKDRMLNNGLMVQNHHIYCLYSGNQHHLVFHNKLIRICISVEKQIEISTSFYLAPTMNNCTHSNMGVTEMNMTILHQCFKTESQWDEQ